MPINTDLSVSPYFDDFDAENNFFKVLFKPSVAPQVREMNQLQTILQDQIEKFGNNIYKRGSIIDGCNFIYYKNYPYIKLFDNTLSGDGAVPANYVGHFIKDASANLVAQVIAYEDGFESTTPDLKTLYVRYLNSGSNGGIHAFTSNAALTVYDYENSIHSIDVNNGGTGFSNSDSISVVSALAVNVTSVATFSNGEQITATGKRAVIIGIDANTYESKTILKIRPVTADLSNTSVYSNTWTFANATSIVGGTSAATADILEIVGESATASLETDAAIGKLVSVSVSNTGSGYYVVPYVAVKSAGLTTPNYNDIDLEAFNYIDQIRISNTAAAVGNGYAFGVTEGIVYQKGHFIRVDAQNIVVSKYDPIPHNLSIGFDISEEIINSDIDTSLLDNVVDGEGEFAPGADRLKLTAELVVVNTATISSNDEFFSIVDFSGGLPFRENRKTAFNSVSDELAKRTFETSGDFVLDRFYIATDSASSQANEGKYFNVVSDPGKAYLAGYRVETLSNFSLQTEKGIDTATSNSITTAINYGNYINVKELSGVFQFSTGDTVSFYDTAKGYISNTTLVTTANNDAVGTLIGTARIRSLVQSSGEIGTANCVYKLYLFDINMSTAKNFRDIKSIRYVNETKIGICDAVLTPDATTGANIATLVTGNDKLVFDVGVESAVNLANVSYIYRTMTNDIALANTGIMTLSIAANPNEFFTYNSPVYGSLTAAQRETLVLIPTNNDIQMAFTNGTISAGATNVVSGTGTDFVNWYRNGDFAYLYGNTTTSATRRITRVTNSTHMTLDSAPGFTNAVAVIGHTYPKNIPVPLERISGATANVDGAGNLLTIDLGAAINAAASIAATLVYDVEKLSITPTAKTPVRDIYVRINPTTNETGLMGPWCLGHADAFRLSKVYTHTSDTVNASSTDVTDQFFIDSNQTGSYLGLSYLYKNPKASITIDANTWLLAKFDVFDASLGVYTITSYVSSNTDQRFSVDSTALASLGSNVHSLEIPELYTYDGEYYDLANCIDFRPIAVNTAARATTVANANTNPASNLSFGNTANIANDRKFPLPETSAKYDVTHFMGRRDLIILSPDNQISAVRGAPSANGLYSTPKAPSKTLILNKIDIPAYPSIPENFSANTYAIMQKRMSNEKFLFTRLKRRMIKRLMKQSDIIASQVSGYTMASIGKLERRIKNLEYYVALNLLETDLKNRTIPSTISPTINRFKYGFFADDYTTTTYSDLDNPEYKVDVVGGKAVPKSDSTLIQHGNTHVCLDYVEEYAIVNQPIASEPITATTNSTANTTASNTYIERIQANNSPGRANNTYTDTLQVQMSETSGDVSLRFYNYVKPDWIGIYKNDVLIVSTANAVAWSNTDVQELQSTALFYPMRDNLLTTLTLKAGANTGWGVMYAGKLTFTHSASDGTDYEIVVKKAAGSAKWKYRLDYPVDTYSSSPLSVPSSNVTTTQYNGECVYEPITSAPLLDIDRGNFHYGTQCDPVNVEIFGLRPFTVHNIRVNQVNQANTIRPIHNIDIAGVSNSMLNTVSAIQNTVITNSRGAVTVQIFNDTRSHVNIRDITGAEQIVPTAGVPRNIPFEIISADGTSSANVVVVPTQVFNTPINNDSGMTPPIDVIVQSEDASQSEDVTLAPTRPSDNKNRF